MWRMVNRHRSAQLQYGALARTVGSQVRTPRQRGIRRDIDDDTPVALHQPDCRTTDEKCSIDVDSKSIRPLLVRCLLHSRVVNHAGAVDHDIEPPEQRMGLADQRRTKNGVTNISRNKLRDTSATAKPLHQCLTASQVAACDDHIGATLRKRLCDCLANTGGCAGYQDSLAAEIKARSVEVTHRCTPGSMAPARQIRTLRRGSFNPLQNPVEIHGVIAQA